MKTLEVSAQEAVQINRVLWKSSPQTYFSDCLKIKNKRNKLLALEMNKNQKLVQEAISRQRAAGKPVRILILKYRQGGFSTLAAANIFHNCRFHGGNYMVVSLDIDSVEHIFRIYHGFHHYLPKNEQDILVAAASNRKELKFVEPHGGRIIVETAGKSSAGHSYTLMGLHLSEVSRWPADTEDARAGLLNSVSDAPETMIIVESIANGMSGWFHSEWMRENSRYEKIFVPWYDHPEYTMDLPIKQKDYIQTVTEAELSQMERFGLSLGQVEWRRQAISEKLGGDVEKFKEQYPATDVEAFLATGNMFFHTDTLEAIVPQEGFRCNLEVVTDISRQKTIVPVPKKNGWLRIYRKPEIRHDYVIGADVAEGIEIEGAPQNDKHDYSSADVLDRNTGEQVAQFHGKLTPDEFGRQLALLGEYYNYAFVAPESNAGYGLHVIETMKSEEYPEFLIYKMQVLDEASRRTTEKMGWRTTRANRKTMMTALDISMRDKEIFINSAETIAEMKAFVVKPDGRIEAGVGAKDDRVFSLAIANQMLAVAPAPQTLDYDIPGGMRLATSYKPMRSIYARRLQ